MFVVKKNESANKTVRMPAELIERLEKVAKEQDVSFSRLVIQCCEYALNHMDIGQEPPEPSGTSSL